MAQTVETLIRENIYGVFGEHDAQNRRTKIASLWAEDGVFIDPDARYEGQSGIERAAAGLIEKFPTFTFTERGEVQSYNGVGRLAWGYGPAGAEAVITGIDVLVIKGDKIGALYTFLDGGGGRRSNYQSGPGTLVRQAGKEPHGRSRRRQPLSLRLASQGSCRCN